MLELLTVVEAEIVELLIDEYVVCSGDWIFQIAHCSGAEIGIAQLMSMAIVAETGVLESRATTTEKVECPAFGN